MFITAELGSLTHHSYPNFSDFHSFSNMKKDAENQMFSTSFCFTCDLGEARTLDPLIKSQLLYQLSYEVIFYYSRLTVGVFQPELRGNPPFCDAKLHNYFEITKRKS